MIQSIRDTDRGVVIQVGILTLMGFLAAALVLYQVNVVPQDNLNREMEHDRVVQDDLLKLKESIQKASATGTQQEQVIKLGFDYGDRLIGSNPPPKAGSLQTLQEGTLEIENAEATDNETADFWNGGTQTYSTKSLSYSIDYEQYDSNPTVVLENSLAVNKFSADEILRSEQSLINGQDIALTTIGGGFQDNAVSGATVEVTPISASPQTVAVSNDSQPIVLQIPTRVAEDTWNDTLSDQLVSNGGHVKSIDYTTKTGSPYNTVTVKLEKGVTYSLKMSHIQMGESTKSSSSGYLTTVSTVPDSVNTGESFKFDVQVRDKFNNPVVGSELSAQLNGPGKLTLLNDKTGSDGTIEVRYSAPDSSSDDKAKIEIESKSGGASADLSIDQEVKISNDDSGEDEGEERIGDGTELRLNNPGRQRGVRCNSDVTECTVDISTTSSVDLKYLTTPRQNGVNIDIFNQPGPTMAVPSEIVTDQSGTEEAALKVWDEGEANVTAVAGEAERTVDFTFQKKGDHITPSVIDLSVNGEKAEGGEYYRDAAFTFDYEIRDSDGFDKIKFKAIPIDNRPNGIPTCNKKTTSANSKEGIARIELTYRSFDPERGQKGCRTDEMKLVVVVIDEYSCGYWCSETDKKKYSVKMNSPGFNSQPPHHWVGERHEEEEKYQN